jgi:hypothetical protein
MSRGLPVVLLMALFAECAAAAEIHGVRMWQKPSGTSVVFDLSDPVSYRLTRLANPDRLVVDFERMRTPKTLRLPAVADTPVRGLRYAPRGDYDLRVVLDLTGKVDVGDLLLPALERYGDRLLLKFESPTAIAAATNPRDATAVTQDVAPVPPSGEPTLLDLAPVAGDTAAPITKPTVMQRAGKLYRNTIGAAGDSGAWDISGFYSAELRGFLHEAQYPRQHEANISFAIQPEFYREWDDGYQSLLIVPFARWDKGDPSRTHVDLREFSYIRSASTWELRAGVRKLFWGVAESNHLIDVINQFDVVENIDNEDKLGQPMINVAFVQDWGTIDVFALIGFRERTFPGKKGRLRLQPRVDTSAATYDSAAENTHIDWAARYSHFIGNFDIGLYHFWGTSRDPRLQPKLTSSNELVLAPHYDIIHQTATDVQATKGNWLFKFEGLRRSGFGKTYYATVGGFEYTFVGVFDTAMDVGVLGEYHFDDRGDDALSPFNNDVFTGSRLAFNDVQDTAVLAGIFADLDGRSKFFNIEASRRLGSTWKIEAEMRVFWDVEGSDPFFSIRRDDYVQLELARYF